MTPVRVDGDMDIFKVTGAGIGESAHVRFVPRWAGGAGSRAMVNEIRDISQHLTGIYDALAGNFREYLKI